MNRLKKRMNQILSYILVMAVVLTCMPSIPAKAAGDTEALTDLIEGEIGVTAMYKNSDMSVFAPITSGSEVDRNAKLQLDISYNISNEKLATAKGATQWTYSLADILGSESKLKMTATSGDLTSGDIIAGTYSISPEGIVTLKVDPDFWGKPGKESNISGKLSLNLEIDPEAIKDADSVELVFDGTSSSINLDMKDVDVATEKACVGVTGVSPGLIRGRTVKQPIRLP